MSKATKRTQVCVWKAEKHVGGWQGVAKLPVARSGSAKTRGAWRSRASRDNTL